MSLPQSVGSPRAQALRIVRDRRVAPTTRPFLMLPPTGSSPHNEYSCHSPIRAIRDSEFPLTNVDKCERMATYRRRVQLLPFCTLIALSRALSLTYLARCAASLPPGLRCPVYVRRIASFLVYQCGRGRMVYPTGKANVVVILDEERRCPAITISIPPPADQGRPETSEVSLCLRPSASPEVHDWISSRQPRQTSEVFPRNEYRVSETVV